MQGLERPLIDIRMEQCVVCCPFKITTKSACYVTFHPANINLSHYLSGRPAIVLSSIRMCVLLLHIATVTKPLGVGTYCGTFDIQVLIVCELKLW